MVVQLGWLADMVMVGKRALLRAYGERHSTKIDKPSLGCGSSPTSASLK